MVSGPNKPNFVIIVYDVFVIIGMLWPSRSSNNVCVAEYTTLACMDLELPLLDRLLYFMDGRRISLIISAHNRFFPYVLVVLHGAGLYWSNKMAPTSGTTVKYAGKKSTMDWNNHRCHLLLNCNSPSSKWTFKYIKTNVLYSATSTGFENLLGQNMPLITIYHKQTLQNLSITGRCLWGLLTI